VTWTRRVSVVDSRSDSPLHNQVVRIRSLSGAGSGEIREVATGANGMAEFTLTERIIRPAQPPEARSAANVTKYRVSVHDQQGRELAAPRDVSAHGKDYRPITINVP